MTNNRKVVAVATAKGGAGKTTTAYYLGQHYHSQGADVLLIDANPNGTLTAWYDLPLKYHLRDHIGDAIMGRQPLAQVALPVGGRLAVVPSLPNLQDSASALDNHPMGLIKAADMFSQQLPDLTPNGRPLVVIIDCPDNLGTWVQSMLVAADLLVVPSAPVADDIAGARAVVNKWAELRAELGRLVPWAPIVGAAAPWLLCTKYRKIHAHNLGLDSLWALASTAEAQALGIIPLREYTDQGRKAAALRKAYTEALENAEIA